ncbi:MAG: homoserine dehydrogenase [Pseudomonadota bacterium]
MTAKTINVGVCGLGTVGAGTVAVLQRNAPMIVNRAQAQVCISHVGVRHDRHGCELGDAKISRDVFDVASDPDLEILVELIGGTDAAKNLVEMAIDHGKHVVTANKALIAEFGNELFERAANRGVELRFEAAVAGGIPIIKALREGLAANQVSWLAGIINGTGNFILTEMRDKGREFASVLAEAQELGYAEADPTFDVEGIDAAHKLVILASIAFGVPLKFDSVYTEGITQLTTQDVEYAQELGYVIKHLGIAKAHDHGIELRVHPTLIPKGVLLAGVDGVKNAVLVEGDAVGPTLYYGAGAGAAPTASAVVADIVDLARSRGDDQRVSVPSLGVASDELRDQPVVAMARVESPWYLRMEALDKPGVLSKVANILGEQGISVEAVIQKPPAEGQSCVQLIMVTNKAAQEGVDQAVASIESLDAITSTITRIRVEELDG